MPPMTQTPTPATTPSLAQKPDPWHIEDSAALYDIARWGQGYFTVNRAGHVEIHPDKTPARRIALKQLVDSLRRRGVQLPLLIRFADILKHRIGELYEAFRKAIAETEYRGGYTCVYPIKVNQQRHVVKEILNFGRPFGFGVEAGSKPELLAAMALVEDDATPIICNGFKDDEYIEAVILAAKLGKNIIPVVEKFSELELIAKYAKVHDVRPHIGVRVKLAARGAGRWESSGGARSKFGLFPSEVIDAVDFLRDRNMLDCLRLLHFHLGSQINNIRNIKAAITELTRVYVELRKAGAAVETLDVGGGLGVDYDGSKTDTDSSMNYTLQEYANDVIYHVMEVCDQAKVPHPRIITESGRAMVAYHSVLVFNVLGRIGFDQFAPPQDLSAEKRAELPKPVQVLWESNQFLSPENYREYYHDAQQAREQTLNLFNLGYCSLRDRALAEKLFYSICRKVQALARSVEDRPEELAGLDAELSDTYFCNWSIFQSLPDSWAIEQLFPIMPIHRLEERPTSRGIIGDITCDSDGKIDRFLNGRNPVPKSVLELHRYDGREDEGDYLLGAFLVGAYQEILGDMHNLFGDTNAVHVRLDDQGKPHIDAFIEGDTVREVLNYVAYSANELRRSMRERVNLAIANGRLSRDESELLLRFYESGLEGYTYLE